MRIWGGYSPKIYNGDWVKLCINELIRDFQGIHILADTHYETANRTLMKQNENPSVKFYYPYIKLRGRKRKRVERFENNVSYNETSLTKEQ